MKRVIFLAISITLTVCCFGCTVNDNARQDPVLVPTDEREVISQDTNSPPSDNSRHVFKLPDGPKLPKEPELPAEDSKGKNQSSQLAGGEKDVRRFTRMTQRIADSLRVTPGAVLRLHPDDSILFRSHILNRPLLSPKRDPQSGGYLPFPYAYPQRYATDIRRLDSIKAVHAPKPSPTAHPDSVRR